MGERHVFGAGPCCSRCGCNKASIEAGMSCRPIPWVSKPCDLQRPTIQVMDGETGKTLIESDPAWFCDLLTVDGIDVVGYIGPEHEDVPPCCPAPTPRAP